MPPKPAKGREDKIVKGWMKLSYKIPKTMYMTTAAARSRSRVLRIVEEMAFADPSNEPLTWLGKTCAAISSTFFSPS